jgi:FkbM family methyltransferase
MSRKLAFPGWERMLRMAFPPDSFRDAELTVDYDDGLKIYCNPSSYIEWSIFFLGQYGAPTAQIIKSLLHEGDWAADIGANIGAYTLVMSKSVGGGGRVDAFEPNPEVYLRLLANLKLNHFCDRTKVRTCALSAGCGLEMLQLPSSTSWNRGTATLVQRKCHGDAIRVEVETLDNVARDWRRCDLIKIDTDGNDFSVLQGASKTIRRFLPNLVFEFDPDLWPNAAQNGWQIRQELAVLGYDFFHVDQRWRGLRQFTSVPFPKGNILALARNRQSRLI